MCIFIQIKIITYAAQINFVFIKEYSCQRCSYTVNNNPNNVAIFKLLLRKVLNFLLGPGKACVGANEVGTFFAGDSFVEVFLFLGNANVYSPIMPNLIQSNSIFLHTPQSDCILNFNGL